MLIYISDCHGYSDAAANRVAAVSMSSRIGAAMRGSRWMSVAMQTMARLTVSSSYCSRIALHSEQRSSNTYSKSGAVLS